MANMAARFAVWNAPEGYRSAHNYEPIGIPADDSPIVQTGEYELVGWKENGELVTGLMVREVAQGYIVRINPLDHWVPYRALRPEEARVRMVVPAHEGAQYSYKYNWVSPVTDTLYYVRVWNNMYSHGVDYRLAYRRTCTLCRMVIPDNARAEEYTNYRGEIKFYPVVCDHCCAYRLTSGETIDRRRSRALRSFARTAQNLDTYVSRSASGMSRISGDEEACALAQVQGDLSRFIRWSPSGIRDFSGLVGPEDLAAALAAAGVTVEDVLSRHEEGGKEWSPKAVRCYCHNPQGEWR